MANEFDWFPFYPKDFAGDGKVEAMTTQAVGAYILLLCKAWAETPPASVPNDDSTLARWSRVAPDVWTGIRSMVLSPFVELPDGRLSQPRLLDEWKKAKSRSTKAKRAAETRWIEGRCSGNALASLPHSDPHAQHVDVSVPVHVPPESEGGVGGNHVVPLDRMPLPLSVCRGVLNLYPRKKRGLPRTACIAIQNAHQRISDTPGHPGEKNALAWLQARTEIYARSALGRSMWSKNAEHWYDGDGFDAPDEAWDRAEPETDGRPMTAAEIEAEYMKGKSHG